MITIHIANILTELPINCEGYSSILCIKFMDFMLNIMCAVDLIVKHLHRSQKTTKKQKSKPTNLMNIEVYNSHTYLNGPLYNFSLYQ